MARVEWDEAAFQSWFRDPNRPVLAELMPRLGARTVASAQARYHRITGNTAGSIHYETGSDSQGPYCNVGGSYVIRFLEKPASQMHSPRRWLSDAVREIAGALPPGLVTRRGRLGVCDQRGDQDDVRAACHVRVLDHFAYPVAIGFEQAGGVAFESWRAVRHHSFCRVVLSGGHGINPRSRVTRVAGKIPANGAADTAAAAEKAARTAQAKTSGAKTGDTITWKGETFRLEPGELPGMAQMILTHFAAADPSVRDPDAEDGMWQLLEMLLAQPSGPQPGEAGFDVETYGAGEFRRFTRHAAKTRASLEEIVEAMQAAVEVFAARPTARRPGSSGGQPGITASSTGSSSAVPGEVLSG